MPKPVIQYNQKEGRKTKTNQKGKKKMEMLLNKLHELYAESIRLMEAGKWDEAHALSAEISKVSAEIHNRPF